MFQVHPLAILALMTVLMCWGLSALLFRTGMPAGNLDTHEVGIR